MHGISTRLQYSFFVFIYRTHESIYIYIYKNTETRCLYIVPVYVPVRAWNPAAASSLLELRVKLSSPVTLKDSEDTKRHGNTNAQAQKNEVLLRNRACCLETLLHMLSILVAAPLA